MINTHAVFFDLDGTIADTNALILECLAQTLAHATGRTWTTAEILPSWGLLLRDQLSLLAPEIDLERAVPYYRDRYATDHDAMLCEFPDMREMLATLVQADYPLAVVTSKKRAHAEQTLTNLGYTHFFSLLVAEEDAPRVKPAPDPLLRALAHFNLAPEDACYLGDNPDDIYAAHAAGMPAIAVAWSMRPHHELHAARPDAFIHSPGELLRILGLQKS